MKKLILFILFVATSFEAYSDDEIDVTQTPPDANQIFDHALQSPTFRETIKNNLEIYLLTGSL